MLAIMKSCLIGNKVYSTWEVKHAWDCKSSQVLGGSEGMYLKREPGTFPLLDQHPSWKSHFTANRNHHRKPQPVIIQISTDNGMSSPNRYIYSFTPVPTTQGTSKEMGGKIVKVRIWGYILWDCTSLKWQGSFTLDASTVMLSKQDTNNNTNRHAVLEWGNLLGFCL